jgi:predicted transcriptional regulator
MMPHVLVHGQSIPSARRQIAKRRPIAGASSAHRRSVSPPFQAAVTKGLSRRAARLLLEGDHEGRYAGRNDSEAGYRLTMALATAASQPGRQWTPGEFAQALIYTPTPGGAWARELYRSKGAEYAERKLAAMLDKARQYVTGRPAITCRQDAFEKLQHVRRHIERMVWSGRCGDTDLKNLTVRLRECERLGGPEHEMSVRRLAEEMNCAKNTAQDSNTRLKELGFLALVTSGRGQERGSRWVLRVPPEAGDDRGAQLGQCPATEVKGGQAPVSVTHDDTRKLARIIGHDAFHRWAHGANGARVLTQLDTQEGRSVKELAEVLGLHRTTVARRLDKLMDDRLVEELDGLFYLAAELDGGDGVRPESSALDKAAERRETQGAQARRRDFHRVERAFYRTLRERVQQKVNAWIEERRRLVPEGAVDLATGEITDPAWQGWDVSDPYRPVPKPAWAA